MQQGYSQRPETNGKAIAAFVIALFCWLVTPITGILAVVFGWLALRDISRGKKSSGKGLALAAIIIPLSLYGLWWFVIGLLLWFALGAFRDVLSLLQIEGIYDDIGLFDSLEDRAIILIVSGILSMASAIVIPIILNRAIVQSRSLTKRQELLLAGWPIVSAWLLISGLIGSLFLLLSLFLVSIAVSVLLFVYLDGVTKSKYSLVEREHFFTPRDVTASRLTIVLLAWAVVLISILVLWVAVSELLVWYLALITGLATGVFAWLVVPKLLGIDVEALQPIEIKEILLTVSGPILALVLAGLLWWILFLLTFLGLSAGAFVRLRIAARAL